MPASCASPRAGAASFSTSSSVSTSAVRDSDRTKPRLVQITGSRSCSSRPSIERLEQLLKLEIRVALHPSATRLMLAA
jgi:hypothetical protein